jgi:hypothetical protein
MFTGQPNPQLAEFIESGAENGSIFGDLLPTIRKRKLEQKSLTTTGVRLFGHSRNLLFRSLYKISIERAALAL